MKLSASTSLNLIVGSLAAAAALSLAVGLNIGLLLLLPAVVLGATQRSRLARAISAPDTTQRGRHLTTAAILAAICAGTVAVAIVDLAGDDAWGNKVIVYNAVFLLSLLGAAGYAIAGLLTPKTRATAPHDQ